ncbi:death ligand signal enhancer isoform X1 [Mustela lutreola]|uniref:death ligand signal enhancer isoform X1 n=1 Tax=Mustela lutreola TaxID=9666 RepID=UPI00279752CF|nr:death ligand signal enhancer isoform X1 [Mustela lutreola]XP_059030875.1 death ligand signal enhancer isoform X1 [Mustela lutreola]XP_059030876.1 death ligand signal enhancer isoform X1 [Mustela lutreola]
MWRLPGLLGRALPRLLGPGLWGVTPKSTNPAGPQAASSNLLVPVPSFDRSGPHGPGPGTNRGPRSHGWKDAFQWMSSRISPNTLWDAVSWGTLAVLALQLARQIHFQSSLPAGPRQAGCCSWHSPLDRFLSSSLWHPCSSLRRHILPSPDVPAPRHTDPREPRLGQEECSTQPENLSSHSSLRASGPQGPCEEDPSDLSFLSTSGNFQPRAEPAQLQSTGEKQEQEKSKTLSLEEAVTSIQQLFQLTISIAFNFLGTENMRNGDYVAAFSYFQKAADYGYSKAQYNVGLCHEHGRGTPKDLGKAVLSYQLAASQGHRLAQYRYARCLLQGPASEGAPKRQRAVSMLKQAADSGLREAQAFLGVLFTKEPHLDEQSAVKYFWLAANNGDSQSRYHLGICFEKGLGVRRSLGEAVRCYQQSAALGNEPAQERLQTLFSMEAAGKALGTSNLAVKGLKSFSSPSLHSFNTLLAGASHLPHASTTGNLGLLCRSGCLRASPGAPNMTLPPFSYPLERSLVRLGFG